MDDPVTASGAIFGRLVVVPLIVVGITFLFIKFVKKRAMTRKEYITAAVVGLVLAVVALAGAARDV